MSRVGESRVLFNGKKIPSLGLGTSAGNADELELALDEALRLGYRLIDTAMLYGNEGTIGKTVGKWVKSGKVKREELFIITKLPTVGLHPSLIPKFLGKSLENLQLDYVDLYLIHFPVACIGNGTLSPVLQRDATGNILTTPTRTNWTEVWRAMETLVDEGRAKAIGLSNFNELQIREIVKIARIQPANLQIECHLFLQQDGLIEFCQGNNITITAYSPLGSPNYNQRLSAYSHSHVEKQLPNVLSHPDVVQLAQKYGKSPAQINLRFLMQKGVIPIPKSTNPKRLKENFQIFDFSLSEEEMVALKQLNVGEEARISDFLVFTGLEKHPDFPFAKK